MKKTFTININGTIFHIEEDAYEALLNYFNTLKIHFSNEKDGNEIISDIEARVGEIFSEKSTETNKVVTIDWVNEAIGIMGKPEDILDEDGATETSRNEVRRSRRLYRDPERRIIGGVCGGLGAYFEMDPLFFRIIFIILFFAGPGILVYPIFWLVVPKARTTAELLEMRGQEATVKNIKNWVQEEEKDLKENYRKFKNSDTYSSGKRNIIIAGEAVAGGVGAFLRILVILMGVLIIFGALAGLIALISSLVIGNTFADGWNWGPPAILNQIADKETLSFGLTAIGFVIGIPLIALIFIGSKLIFRYKTNNAAIGLMLSGLWLLSLVILLVLSAGQIGNFRKLSNQNKSETLDCNSCKTLHLKLMPDKYKDFPDSEIDINGLIIKTIDGKDVAIARPTLDIEKSLTNEFTILMKTSARGKTEEQARINCENIAYKYELKDSTLWLEPYFLPGENQKWRNQEVEIIIRVPEGKSVFISEETDALLGYVDNVSNTSGNDMGGKTWVMMPDGLTYNDLATKKINTLSNYPYQTLNLILNENKFENDIDFDGDINGMKIKAAYGKSVIIGRPSVNIQKSSSNDYVILMNLSAIGNNDMESQALGRNVQYVYHFKDSTLALDPYFLVNEKDGWKKQKVEITIKVPEGKAIYLSNEMKRIIKDIRNTSNTEDSEMAGKTWVMAPDGLTLKHEEISN